MVESFHNDPRLPFFDRLAVKWNEMQDFTRQERELAAFLIDCGVAGDEHVGDIGCGTGTLTRVLLRHLDAGGRVHAVDFSREMLTRAQAAHTDTRVSWHRASAESVPLAAGALDRIICYSAWPHFRNPGAVLAEWRRLLKPGGAAHILHLISRDEVNHIHANTSDPAVHQDLLAPVAEVARHFLQAGFVVVRQEESASHYLLSATSAAPCRDRA